MFESASRTAAILAGGSALFSRRSMARDSKETRKAILKALARLLARSGFQEVGINAIAREAGVDKVLIYRYFGGLPQVLNAFAKESDFWPDLPELVGEIEGSPASLAVGDRARLMLVAFGRALRKRPLTQAIMCWELLEHNELTNALARHREQQGLELFGALQRESNADVRAIGSILAAGLTYLLLRAKAGDVYNGLDMNNEEDWRRIERAAGFLVEAAFEKAGRPAPPQAPPKGPRRSRKQTAAATPK
jgi:AcrR family transcriptional regulator